MGKALKLVNKLKRRKKSLNKNKGFRRQDKIDKMDETLNASPSAQKLMRHPTRRLDRNFGQQMVPDPQEASLEMLRLADLTGAVQATATFTGQVAGMTTNVTINANTPGSAGNSISLAFDGVVTITAALAAWNLANPSNQATLAAGNGAQVPDNATSITLSGGVDGALSAQLASGLVRASGAKAGDIVQILEGSMKGKYLNVLSVNYGADTMALEPSTLSGSESGIAMKLQLSGQKKSYN